MRRSRLLRQISLAAYEVDQNKKKVEVLEGLITEFQSSHDKQEDKEDSEFITDDLSELLNLTVKAPGLRWRLDCLNESLGSLRQGDFGFVFARPETGKTTFLCSEVSYMLDQTDKDILWFNNEEAGTKVKLRFYQAYFGLTLEQLYGNVQHYSDLFRKQSGGRFKLFDSAQINRATVEKLSQKYNPGLILFDQIDKLQGFQADREDLLLGRVYQWARELAKEYCPVLGATQADGSGEGVRWLTMANVANAKTSKQAEADFILGIGAIQDTGWEGIRFINISKNKLIGGEFNSKPTVTASQGGNTPGPAKRHGKYEVGISPDTARYYNLNQ